MGILTSRTSEEGWTTASRNRPRDSPADRSAGSDRQGSRRGELSVGTELEQDVSVTVEHRLRECVCRGARIHRMPDPLEGLEFAEHAVKLNRLGQMRFQQCLRVGIHGRNDFAFRKGLLKGRSGRADDTDVQAADLRVGSDRRRPRSRRACAGTVFSAGVRTVATAATYLHFLFEPSTPSCRVTSPLILMSSVPLLSTVGISMKFFVVPAPQLVWVTC